VNVVVLIPSCKAGRSDDFEVRVLARIAGRLLRGSEIYGRLDVASDRRDFAKEAREEIEDFLVYAACGWLRRS
jgi:hypothetical protein